MAINLGSIEIGKKYEIPSSKEIIASFTATKSELLLFDGGDMTIYRDSDHKDPLSKGGSVPEVKFAGFGNSGKYTFNVESGKTYYFWSGKHGCMNATYFLLNSLSKLEPVQVSPPEGSVFASFGYGAIDVTFNQPINFKSAFITCESKTIPVTPRKNNSSLNIEVKNQLWSLYQDGTIKGEGQKFTLTIEGIMNDSSTLYNDDGKLVLNYVTSPRPISLTNSVLPKTFRSSFDPNDSDSVISLTFDGNVDANSAKVNIFYGNRETRDFYSEPVKYSVQGNELKINLAGKRRTPKDMLRSGNIYPTIGIHLTNICDDKGNIAWSDDPGSVGGFTFNFPYQP